MGDVPLWWYREYPHVGYDLDGRRIIKPPQRDQIDEFLKLVFLHAHVHYHQCVTIPLSRKVSARYILLHYITTCDDARRHNMYIM